MPVGNGSAVSAPIRPTALQAAKCSSVIGCPMIDDTDESAAGIVSSDKIVHVSDDPDWRALA